MYRDSYDSNFINKTAQSDIIKLSIMISAMSTKPFLSQSVRKYFHRKSNVYAYKA